MRRLATLTTALLVAAASLASAQQPESTSTRPVPARAGRLGRGRAALEARGQNTDQQELVRRVRQAFSGVVRRQLNLNDDQARQLQRVEKKYQQQRAQITRDEHQTRLALAAAILDTTGSVDQDKIAGYMDQLVAAQHKRADLLEAEQKELAGFLTPLQRAKYQGLREQLTKRVTQMRQQGGGRRGAPPE